MATSGSSDFNRTRNEIVRRALRIIGVLAQGDVMSSAQLSEGAEALNSLVKSLQTEGVRLWTTEWVTKTFTASEEVTGTDGEIYTCIRSHTSATSNKPVTGADYGTYWYKRGSTGGVWADATAYASAGDFSVASDTIGIQKAYLRQNGNTDHKIELVSLEEYHNITTKSTQGVPTALLFEQSLLPRIRLWPQPNNTTAVLHYLRERMIEDFDAASDNPDFYIRWLDTLVYGLASNLADEYQLSLSERQHILVKAERLKLKAMADNQEMTGPMLVDSAYG